MKWRNSGFEQTLAGSTTKKRSRSGLDQKSMKKSWSVICSSRKKKCQFICLRQTTALMFVGSEEFRILKRVETYVHHRDLVDAFWLGVWLSSQVFVDVFEVRNRNILLERLVKNDAVVDELDFSCQICKRAHSSSWSFLSVLLVYHLFESLEILKD